MIVININIGNILQFLKSISTLILTVTGIITCVVSVITLHRNRIAKEESSVAQIEIFPIKILGDPIPKLRIQNFGKSSGEIISVSLDCQLPVDKMIINPFEYYVGMVLASNQSFTTVFAINDLNLDKVPIKEFNVYMKIKSLGKIQSRKCHINYNFLDGYIETQATPEDYVSALNNINQSIQGLQ